MVIGRESPVLLEILQRYETPRNAVLIVHSSIKGLSRQGFRAEPIIEALIDYLDMGTLLMPTMTWRTVTPVKPIFDEMLTPSHTGVLTEIFRTNYATARSLHPTHSVAGYGSAAKILLATHHIGDTSVPSTSPYALARDYPTYILLLGVGLETCTAIHYAEETIAPNIYVEPPEKAEKYELRDRLGNTIPYVLRRHRPLKRNFPKFGPLLSAKGEMLNGEIGGVPWAIMKEQDLLREAFTSLIENPGATLES